MILGIDIITVFLNEFMWKPPVTYRLLKKIFPVLAALIILFATVFPTTAQIPSGTVSTHTATNASLAIPNAAQAEVWRKALEASEPSGIGCFVADYPSTTFKKVRCEPPPSQARITTQQKRPLNVEKERPLDVEKYTGDYVLQSTTPIYAAFGSLRKVENVTSTIGFGNVPGEFNLQINTETTLPGNASGSLCSQSKNPNCNGWLQFVYDSGGSINIQSWGINYGECPSSLNLSGPQSSCGKRTAFFQLPPPLLKFSDLNGATLSAALFKFPAYGPVTAVVKLYVNGHSYMTSGIDITGAYGNWKNAQFNVYGNSGGDESIFNSGSLVSVELNVRTGSGSGNVTCSRIGEGNTTGESTNLTLLPCEKINSGIAFKEGVAPVIASLFPTSASQTGGTSVTLTAGTSTPNNTFVVNGFNPNVVVMFGDTRATVQSCNNTATSSVCTVTVPPGTGINVPVTAANVFEDGTLGPASLPVTFSYFAPLCNLSIPYCLAGSSQQEYKITCSTTVDFIMNGFVQETGTFFVGQELPAYQNTAISACVPNTSNCNEFNTAANHICPVFPRTVPPLKNCESCDETGRRCISVPGGYKCVGLIQ
ncbi:hypothetical protein [Nostoc sp.]|uniref:hypothetical protein n=1 Tax=Nostoc sp. TaxID=1180 RepID=UPI002FF99C87